MTDAPANDAAPKPKMLTEDQAQTMMVDNWVWPAICSTANGIRSSLDPHGVPVGLLMVRMAAMMGRIVGHMVSLGDLGTILRIRGECIKAFTEELRAVKPQTPPLNGDMLKPPHKRN